MNFGAYSLKREMAPPKRILNFRVLNGYVRRWLHLILSPLQVIFRTAARYVRKFAKFIHEVSETIRIFRSTLSNFKLPTWDDIVGWIKDKFDQITGKLDLGQWYDDGKN